MHCSTAGKQAEASSSHLHRLLTHATHTSTLLAGPQMVCPTHTSAIRSAIRFPPLCRTAT